MSDITEQVKRAAEDENEFAKLAAEFERHNKYVAYSVTGRFVTESDEVWSDVLLAFNEAVQKYDPSKGSFRSFSDTVIKRRLIDHIRKDARTAREIPTDIAGAETNRIDDDKESAAAAGEFRIAKVMAEKAAEKAEEENRSTDLRLEIEDLNELLERYGISFTDLAQTSPKAEKTKRQCGEVIRFLAADEELCRGIRKTGTLPAKEIREKCGVPRKIPERHRKYIIAVVEILRGDYPGLQGFVKDIGKEAGS